MRRSATLGGRAEMLRHLMGQAALSDEASKLLDLFRYRTWELHDQVWLEYQTVYEFLPRLQQVNMEILVEKQRARFSPFGEESMAMYRQKTGETRLSTATVQTAIESLRERGLVWRESRGNYVLKDEGFAEWFANRL